MKNLFIKFNIIDLLIILILILFLIGIFKFSFFSDIKTNNNNLVINDSNIYVEKIIELDLNERSEWFINAININDSHIVNNRTMILLVDKYTYRNRTIFKFKLSLLKKGDDFLFNDQDIKLGKNLKINIPEKFMIVEGVIISVKDDE